MTASATEVKIKPIGDKLVLRRLEAEETTSGGIVLPDTAKEKPQEAKVVAVGPGRIDEGKRVALEVKKGDKVLVSKYGGTEIKLDGKEYKILNSDDILAIIN